MAEPPKIWSWVEWIPPRPIVRPVRSRRYNVRIVQELMSSILHHIESLGYAVSVFHIPSSLLGTVAAFTEMHAVLLAEPNDQHIAKVDGHDEDGAYRAACMLAESVGIELEDG